MADPAAIGPYRILEPLGRGGMGIVYRACHSGSERQVALKTVKLAAPLWLDSIRREIQALTRIRHPGVVQILDHGVQQGRPWYAMDLIEGESLRHFCHRIWARYRHASPKPGSDGNVSVTATVSTQLADLPNNDVGVGDPWRKPKDARDPAAAGELHSVLALVRRLCATLAFLHGEGLINSDLKPENVLLLDGKPVVIDFGLTSFQPGRSGREAIEVRASRTGTLPYMSPEQVRGELLDARSDLYSVGCILYELVTGRPPFSGNPATVLAQHLSSIPTAPSELVESVPRELERIILKLLEKNVADRFGYADEVASLLAELAGDGAPLEDFPPARPYLYRPRLVGRDEVLARLTTLRDGAASGSGALALLGGESGIGKTRLAMEVTRFQSNVRMQVVTSEASPLSGESTAAVGSAPLHAVRPFLRAIADRCQQGGAETTARLLGPRRSVLALYEPLLAQVPAGDPLPAVMPLGADASRQRLLKYLAETMALFAQERPLTWVLDDVGWADELSLAFLLSLSKEYLATNPLFILCTYRSEEASPGVAALRGLAHVEDLALSRLDDRAMGTLVADMLAMRSAPESFVTFVRRQSEGNPFFVAEYLRTAVSEGVVYRDERHTWRIASQGDGSPRSYASLSLPQSLRDVIDHRLRLLSPGARELGLAAAVLGRETEVETLLRVTSLDENASVASLDELVRRQVLEQPEPGHVRFVHDKLREVTYGQASAPARRNLHLRAGEVVEATLGAADATRAWATLGHHFAAAERPDRAVHYLKLAANHARATYANEEAIRLYREAIHQMDHMASQDPVNQAKRSGSLVSLHESLADVLSLACLRDEARSAYEQALASALTEESIVRSRLYRKIGKTWETQNQHEAALRQYHRAQECLGTMLVGAPRDVRDEWIQVRIDELWVYYWLGRVPEMAQLSGELEPLIADDSSPLQRSRFFDALMKRNLRRDRYTITSETLAFARTAFMASKQANDEFQVMNTQFNLGFVQLFSGFYELATADLAAALGMAERGGDLIQQTRCLIYLSLAARLLGNIPETRLYTDRCLAVATTAGMREYIGACRANQAWLSLQQNDFGEAVEWAQEAIKLWRSITLVFAFEWMALLPGLCAALALDDLDTAVSYVGALLAPGQQPLPPPAVESLTVASAAWSAGDRTGARTNLSLALRRLEGTVYR
jgi:serine/threonine protein kinase/tetratricopeptide (TPR) repeat protein